MNMNKLVKTGMGMVLMMSLCACGGSKQETISLAGSTSMEKLCEAMSENYMANNEGTTITVEYTGSSAGLESLVSDKVDIGNASRGLKDEEKSKGLVENVVAVDGIAMITDKNNPVKDIKSDDLANIYTGKITNWKQLGGKDQAIVVIGRENGSGTRDAFEELMGVKDGCKYAQELDSTGAVLAKVSTTPGAIGYVSLDVVDSTVSGLKLNSIEANEEEILAGKYILQRPFIMATKGEVSKQNDAVKSWFEFIEGDEGQKIIKSVGLIVPKK